MTTHDDKTIEAPPVSITMIGTGPGTNLAGTTATTPKGSPNLLITHVIHPIIAVLIRFAHDYGTMFVGLLTAAGVGASVIQYDDFIGLIKASAVVALPGPVFGMFKNVVTIFGRLEGKFPLLTGNI